MKNLIHELKPWLAAAVSSAFTDLSAEEALAACELSFSKDFAHGDVACSAPLKLAKRVGMAPLKIAEMMTDALEKDFRVEKVEAAAPGFVNVFLSRAFLEESLTILEEGAEVSGGDLFEGALIVEYPSTNAAKAMGVHHVITTFLGDSLANLAEFLGQEVIRINHFGDWGTHFGKLLYAVDQWGDMAVITKNPTEELTKLYVQFCSEAEKDASLEDEARRIFKALEEGDAHYKERWEWMVAVSLQELETILRRLRISVDHHMGESFYLSRAEEVIEDGLKRGLFVEGEGGALIFDRGAEQTPAMVRKSDGATLYLTRDLATLKYRVETWHPEQVWYVVDHAQSLHFEQVFEVGAALGYLGETKAEHVVFGRMRFQDASMSTRKGNIIKLMDLLDEAAVKAGHLAAEKGSELPRAELEVLRELLGMAAVKYGVLSQDRVKDIVFDWNKVVTLEGNSAPYLLYSYARGHSILAKVGDVPTSGLPVLSEPLELELLRVLLRFPHTLEQAYLERKPHIVATHLYILCQTFNRFYGVVRVADVTDARVKRSRVGLVRAFMLQLKAGLGILGIPVVEQM